VIPAKKLFKTSAVTGGSLLGALGFISELIYPIPQYCILVGMLPLLLLSLTVVITCNCNCTYVS